MTPRCRWNRSKSLLAPLAGAPICANSNIDAAIGELTTMNRSKAKRAVAAGALVTFAMMAAAPSAADSFRGDFLKLETYKTYEEGCARWEREGAGERIKCFDCLKQRGGVWVNTCQLTPRAADWWNNFGPRIGPGCCVRPVSGAIIPGHGIYCETAEKWCVIKERPGLPGTGCFCKVKGGYARGVVE